MKNLLTHHVTRDAVVSAGAAKQLEVARFPADHSSICFCKASGGTVAPETCGGLCVYGADGNELVRFTGRKFRAQQAEDGSISIWALPSTTQDSDYRPCRDHSQRLAAINTKHTEFYTRKDAEV